MRGDRAVEALYQHKEICVFSSKQSGGSTIGQQRHTSSAFCRTRQIDYFPKSVHSTHGTMFGKCMPRIE
jgi:hypothetical protein